MTKEPKDGNQRFSELLSRKDPVKDRVFEPVGSSISVPVRAQLIAASTKRFLGPLLLTMGNDDLAIRAPTPLVGVEHGFVTSP